MAIRTLTTKHGEKRYRVKVFIRLKADGKREEISRTFRRRRDATRWQAEQMAILGKGTYVRPSEEPLGEYLRRWMDDSKRHQVRERTWLNYDRALKRYVLNARVSDVKLSCLTTSKLETFYISLADDGGANENCGPLGAKSIRNVHAILHDALKKAVRDRLIVANPASGALLPKDRQRESGTVAAKCSRRMRILSAPQIARLLDVSSQPPAPKCGTRSGRHSRPWSWTSSRSRNRWHALWHVLVNGGLRPSEALALSWDDVDWEKASVRIDKGMVTGLAEGRWLTEAPKTERSKRIVTLPPETMKAVREHHLQQQAERESAGTRYRDNRLVFAGESGAPIDLKNATRRHFHPLLEAADLPKIRVYDLRHTHASLMLSAGVPVHIVSARLGHASAKMTLDVYGHVLQNQQQDAIEAYEKYLAAEAAKP